MSLAGIYVEINNKAQKKRTDEKKYIHKQK